MTYIIFLALVTKNLHRSAFLLTLDAMATELTVCWFRCWQQKSRVQFLFYIKSIKASSMNYWNHKRPNYWPGKLFFRIQNWGCIITSIIISIDVHLAIFAGPSQERKNDLFSFLSFIKVQSLMINGPKSERCSWMHD